MTEQTGDTWRYSSLILNMLSRTLSDYFVFFNLPLRLLFICPDGRWRHPAWLPVFFLHKLQGHCSRRTPILMKDQSSLAHSAESMRGCLRPRASHAAVSRPEEPPSMNAVAFTSPSPPGIFPFCSRLVILHIPLWFWGFGPRVMLPRSDDGVA